MRRRPYFGIAGSVGSGGNVGTTKVGIAGATNTGGLGNELGRAPVAVGIVGVVTGNFGIGGKTNLGNDGMTNFGIVGTCGIGGNCGVDAACAETPISRLIIVTGTARKRIW
jgi:hypothetical protein